MEIIHGDCLDVMRGMEPESVDAVVTDPPYGLEFMGKEWDRLWNEGGDSFSEDKGWSKRPAGYQPRYTQNLKCAVCGLWKRDVNPCKCPSPEWGAPVAPKRINQYALKMQEWHRAWASETLRVLKPGGHLLAFGGTRTSHRMVCAIEDAGFEIRDSIHWIYGSGFPKSLDVGKQLDKRGGADISWFGPWLRSERQRRGIAQKDLAQHFPSKTGGVTGCVANWELGLNLPTPEQFNRLCEVLGLPFKRISEAEREVVGHNSRKSGWFTAQDGHAITEPATPEAEHWQGWGTALKPAHEPIVVARKPLIGTVASNVMTRGTGALNIDGCRIETTDDLNGGAYGEQANVPRNSGSWRGERASDSNAMRNAGLPGQYQQPSGRWPANIVFTHSLDCGDDCAPDCPVAELDRQSGHSTSQGGKHSGRKGTRDLVGGFGFERHMLNRPTDSGGASRFFPVFRYEAKASRKDRGDGNSHPTVKPTALMQWLVRLITPPGGTVLDPFCGSGSTLVAALREGFDAIGIERDAEYVEIARKRLDSIQPTLELTA